MNKIEGTVKGAEIATPLSGVKIFREDSQGKILEETTSDEVGRWQIVAFEKGNQLVFSFDGYVTKTFTTGEIQRSPYLNKWVSAAPGSGAFIKASPTKKLCTPASRNKATSSAV
ncbi:hypothetical protein THIOM_002566 [Candidatus Thiomargarita nelsonii]|uniref:Uncharacterized protein n=1 Tax=Candidatus Thiomargarita nelsonii TaxID=1003181 RepID=A0A176S0S0_9GAMM|nr:hypothetical protein THIOM_002566 [Candidatus Thiomargarita nelsonii]